MTVGIKRRQVLKFVFVANALVVVLVVIGKLREESSLGGEILSLFWTMVGLRIQQAVCVKVSRPSYLGLVRDWAENINVKVVPIQAIVELLGREPPTKNL